jgi:hypothetical protein
LSRRGNGFMLSSGLARILMKALGLAVAPLGVSALFTLSLDGEIARLRGNTQSALRHFKESSDLRGRRVVGRVLSRRSGGSLSRKSERSSARWWTLFGLAQTLRAQGKTKQAAEAREEFASVWRLAETQLTASRF